MSHNSTSQGIVEFRDTVETSQTSENNADLPVPQCGQTRVHEEASKGKGNSREKEKRRHQIRTFGMYQVNTQPYETARIEGHREDDEKYMATSPCFNIVPNSDVNSTTQNPGSNIDRTHVVDYRHYLDELTSSSIRDSIFSNVNQNSNMLRFQILFLHCHNYTKSRFKCKRDCVSTERRVQVQAA